MEFYNQSNSNKNAFSEVSQLGKTSKVHQEHFHRHFKLPEHNGMGDWRVTLIDRTDNRKDLP